MKVNKLIRDKIPNILIKQGKKFKAHSIIDEPAEVKYEALISKLEEECAELISAFKSVKHISRINAQEAKNISDEWADVREVIKALSSLSDVEIKPNADKEYTNGTFKDFIILDEIEDE